jgi:hypothetical protein
MTPSRATVATALLALTWSWSKFGPACAQERTPEAQLLLTAPAARLRAEPATSARVVATLAMGDLLDELGRSDTVAMVEGHEERWVRVRTAAGAEGWLHGSLTRRVGPEGAAATQLALAREELDREGASFGDTVALASLAGRARSDDRAVQAELELLRLLAIRKAADAIPFGKAETSPYQEWIAARGDDIVYSEPAGQWLLASDQLWALVDRYREEPRAEAFAFTAATNPLPGECEGFVACVVEVFNVSWGRYLRLFPAGPHAGEAVVWLTAELEPVAHPSSPEGERGNDFGSTGEERLALRTALAEARGLVAATAVAGRDELLALIDAVAAKAR